MFHVLKPTGVLIHLNKTSENCVNLLKRDEICFRGSQQTDYQFCASGCILCIQLSGIHGPHSPTDATNTSLGVLLYNELLTILSGQTF